MGLPDGHTAAWDPDTVGNHVLARLQVAGLQLDLDRLNFALAPWHAPALRGELSRRVLQNDALAARPFV